MVVIDGTGEFISDYCKAYVLDADKDFVRFINKDGTFIAQFPRDSTSVYTLAQFKTRKETLKKSKKVLNPKANDRRNSSGMSYDDAIPTIDAAIDADKIPKKNLRKSDLYTLFNELVK